jgi:hypothetical protein
MSSKASERGGEKGSSEQTAMGLGGVNIEGFNDPRAKTGISNVGESKESDPEWVQRKNPEDMHRYMHTKVTGSERVAGENYQEETKEIDIETSYYVHNKYAVIYLLSTYFFLQVRVWATTLAALQ